MVSSIPSSSSLAVDDAMELERNAGLIMGTNNSSIVSKRSVERLYLPEPHFYRYFVRKPQRRAPTINRGYWLRMRAIDWTVRQFLEKPSDEPKIVINLGCGYDPLPFQWLASERNLCSNTKFIDIDYEELLVTKAEIIRNTTKMNALLSSTDGHDIEKSILLNSKEYAVIGCDLRNLRRLERLLAMVCDTKCHKVLCVAEVSLAYMHTDAADALIAWSSRLSPDVSFCLLEQGSPDRPDHPFTSTMVKHFQKIGTPLHSLFEYCGTHTNIIRFQRAGFSHAEVQNLWELWGNPSFLSPSQRLALDHVEPFDEWEEFALFASHYLLVIAHNRPGGIVEREYVRSRRDSTTSIASDISARTVSPFNAGTQWFAMRYSNDSSDATKRHHATAYQLPDQDAIAMHGGVGPKARLSSTVVVRDKHNHNNDPIVPSPELGARCCHTITTLSNAQNVLVGGRGSPTQPMKDCWIQTGQHWTRIDDLPEPRYRHRTVPVTLPDGNFGAVVFGGKTNASRVATDTLLWHPRTGWEVLLYLHDTPIPRFGASFVYLGFNHGLLFGGMRQDGVICQGLWRWRLIIRDNKVAGISFRTSHALNASIGAYPWFSRLGASCGLVRDELLIIGGVAKSGCIPRIYEILSVLGSFSAFNEHEKEMQLKVTSVEPVLTPGMPRPFFIGHSTHRTKTGTLVFMGGGATCFSFGNFYNSGIWVMFEREAGLHVDWIVVKSQLTSTTHKEHREVAPKCISNTPYQAVDSTRITEASALISLIQDSQPAVMRGLELGPCLSAWTPTLLRDKVPHDKVVVIHNSPKPSMNFQKKDFAYKSVTFNAFISALTSPTSHIYLRALSSTNPTSSPADFEIDWPELAPDVQIPRPFSSVLQKVKHSTCLRIANNITMWLHYDVMANVLFQIHGSKKLVLFPPTDIKYLSIPPGSTTSELDIFRHPKVSGTKDKTKPTATSVPAESPTTINGTDKHDMEAEKDQPKLDNDEVEILVPEGTSPRIVVLEPGDALFIPPLWAHAGISLRHKTRTPAAAQPKQSPSLSTQDTPIRPNTSSTLPDTTSNPQSNTDAESGSDMTDIFDTQHSAQQARQAKQAPHETNEYTNIALNVFFRSLPRQKYAAGQDIYGNRDLAAYEDARRDLDRIAKRFGSDSSATFRAKARASGAAAAATTDSDGNGHRNGEINVEMGITSSIPRDVARAYLERLADELRRKANEL